MEQKYGFFKMHLNEFQNWIANLAINRSVFFIQHHHTYRPNYAGFDGDNHFALQKSMKDYHVTHNGWSDIGQHFSIFPDGMVVTGRSIERSPACIYANNANAICIESVGNFNIGGDQMRTEQRQTIIRATAALCMKLGIRPNSNSILYHHWFNLTTGERNNGTGGNKTCPGSDFFGGNKVEDCENNFLPLVRAITGLADENITIDDFDKLVCVTATRLNVRTGPGSNNSKASGIKSVKFGTILKSFRVENGWCKINASAEHWVSAKYTKDVFRGEITASVLNVRLGPSTENEVVDTLKRGENIIIEKEQNGWYKLNLEEKWVSKSFVDLL